MPAEWLGDIDAVLLTHDHHVDNLDDTGRVPLRAAGRVVIMVAGSRRLGTGSAVAAYRADGAQPAAPVSHHAAIGR